MPPTGSPAWIVAVLIGLGMLAVTLRRQWLVWRKPPPDSSPPPNPLRKVVHLSLVVWVVLALLPGHLAWVGLAIWLLGFLIGWQAFSQPQFQWIAWRAEREPWLDVGLISFPAVCYWGTLLLPAWGAALLLIYLAVGDGLASLIGNARMRPLPWNRQKSWAGLGGFLLSGPVALLVLSMLAGRPDGSLAALSFPPLFENGSGFLFFAMALALIETLPGRLDDNLRIGLCFLLLWWLTGGLLH